VQIRFLLLSPFVSCSVLTSFSKTSNYLKQRKAFGNFKMSVVTVLSLLVICFVSTAFSASRTFYSTPISCDTVLPATPPDMKSNPWVAKMKTCTLYSNGSIAGPVYVTINTCNSSLVSYSIYSDSGCTSSGFVRTQTEPVGTCIPASPLSYKNTCDPDPAPVKSATSVTNAGLLAVSFAAIFTLF
jgi:hypothetical protein